ncbi:unnamed protein product [Aphanomyces euteiches]
MLVARRQIGFQGTTEREYKYIFQYAAMLSIQNVRSWTGPEDVVLLPSMIKIPKTAPSTPKALPSITALLHRQSLSPQRDFHHEIAPLASFPAMVPDASKKLAQATKPRWRLSKYCTVEGCERVSQRNGLCHRHGGKRSCKEESCRAKDRGNGYCIRHGGGRPCDVANCGKKARRQGMCTQHYRLMHHAS